MSKPVLTLEAFADWAASKPANEEYDYAEPCSCAAARFLQEVAGYPTARVAGNHYRVSAMADEYLDLPGWVDGAALTEPWTFGALATRLASRLRAVSQP